MIQVMFVWWTDVTDPAKDPANGVLWFTLPWWSLLKLHQAPFVTSQSSETNMLTQAHDTLNCWLIFYVLDCIASSKCWAFYSWSVKTFSGMVPRLHPASRCCNVSVAVHLVSSGKQITAGWRKTHYYQYSSDSRHRHQDLKLKLCTPKTGNTDLITTD